jgi:ubiquinone/menaquinone biosynthesis C-methylase UbiE
MNNAEQVRTYYNTNTDRFLEVYGDIIQAFRTNNVEDYLDYTLSSMALKNGQTAIDAGCGVCGPAIHFAKKITDVRIEACTISDYQYEKGLSRVEMEGLMEKVIPRNIDYHELSNHFENIDLIYFLESFGHSADKNTVLDECWETLKPGGRVYIKDLFKRVSDDEWEQLRINEICEDINKAYCYHIADLNTILTKIRSKGFKLLFMKIPEVDTSEFENLTISNDFQNLFNIGKIESWSDYIFPIDFYEILIEKPKVASEKDLHLYMLNNELKDT